MHNFTEILSSKLTMISQDYLRHPQKEMFFSSFIGLFIGDIMHVIALIIENQEVSHYPFYLICLSVQFFFFLVFLVLALTCWRGCFFQKLWETHLRRFLFFYILIVLHINIILNGFCRIGYAEKIGSISIKLIFNIIQILSKIKFSMDL